MFYASLLFCFMSMGQSTCMVAEDSYSPYDTLHACEQRLVEMSKALETELPYATVTQTKCEAKHYTLTDGYDHKAVMVYLMSRF